MIRRFEEHCVVLTEQELGRIVEAAAHPEFWTAGTVGGEGRSKCVLGHAQATDLYDLSSPRYDNLHWMMAEFDSILAYSLVWDSGLQKVVALYSRMAKDELHRRALAENQRRNADEAVLQEAVRAPWRRIGRAEVQDGRRSAARAR